MTLIKIHSSNASYYNKHISTHQVQEQLTHTETLAIMFAVQPTLS